MEKRQVYHGQLAKQAKKRSLTKAVVLASLGVTGTLLSVQQVNAKEWTANTPQSIQIEEGATSYTLKYGDTLWAVSMKVNINVQTLASINNIDLTSGEQYNLAVGTVINFDGSKLSAISPEGEVIGEEIVANDSNKIDPSKPIGTDVTDSVVNGTVSSGNVVGAPNNTGGASGNANSGASNANNGNTGSVGGNHNGNGSEETEKPSGENQGNGGSTGSENGNSGSENQGGNETEGGNQEGNGNNGSENGNENGNNGSEGENGGNETEGGNENGGSEGENGNGGTEKPEKVNKESLQQLVDNASKIDYDELYTEESGKAVKLALVDAQKVLDDEEATQAEVDTASVNLQKALDNLELKDDGEKPVEQKVIVTKSIDGVVFDTQTISGKEGTKQTVTADKKIVQEGLSYVLQGADKVEVEFGKTVNVNFDYKAEMGTVTIKYVFDKDKEAVVKTFTAQVGSKFTANAETFEGYTLSGNNAQTVTVADKNEVTFHYTKDVVAPVVNKEALQNLVNQVKNTEKGNYTDESWNAFSGALNNANTVLANSNATQQEVDTATQALQQGFDNLQEKEVTPPVDDDLESIARQLEGQAFGLINGYRSQNNLVQLGADGALQAGATVRAKEIEVSFSHGRPDGRPYYTAAEELGYGNLAWGENIGKFVGYTLEDIKANGASMLVQAWKDSPGHDANLKDKDINEGAVGVYIVKNADMGYNVYFVFMSGINDNLPTSKTTETTSRKVEEPTAESTAVEAETTEEVAEPTEETQVVDEEEPADTEEPSEEIEEEVVEQDEVLQADKALEVNKDALKELYNFSNTLDEGAYTLETWSTLMVAKGEAKLVYDNVDATQQEVDKVTKALQEAINGLK